MVQETTKIKRMEEFRRIEEIERLEFNHWNMMEGLRWEIISVLEHAQNVKDILDFDEIDNQLSVVEKASYQTEYNTCTNIISKFIRVLTGISIFDIEPNTDLPKLIRQIRGLKRDEEEGIFCFE